MHCDRQGFVNWTESNCDKRIGTLLLNKAWNQKMVG